MKEVFKVIIAGTRDFSDYSLMEKKCDHILKGKCNIEVVSGVARGADKLGEVYAKNRGFSVKQFQAKWSELGVSAGYVRNAEMAEYADALIAFWDGKSKGTKHMIDLAKKADLQVRVIKYV